MLNDAQFQSKKINHDIYYDFPDYRLYKNWVYFRNRNGKFELKIGDDEMAGVCEEIEDDEEIKKYFKTNKPLVEFIADNLIPTIEWKCKRAKYKIEEFTIDIDELDFGYKCVEVELLVKDKSSIEEARSKIIKLAKSFGWDTTEVPPKRIEYFRIVKPEIYKDLYKDKDTFF